MKKLSLIIPVFFLLGFAACNKSDNISIEEAKMIESTEALQARTQAEGSRCDRLRYTSPYEYYLCTQRNNSGGTLNHEPQPIGGRNCNAIFQPLSVNVTGEPRYVIEIVSTPTDNPNELNDQALVIREQKIATSNLPVCGAPDFVCVDLGETYVFDFNESRHYWFFATIANEVGDFGTLTMNWVAPCPQYFNFQLDDILLGGFSDVYMTCIGC